MNTKHLEDGRNCYTRGDEFRLTDLSVWRIDDNIIEAVVDEGVDATAAHVRELFDHVYKMTPVPIASIINRENDYSVDLSILREIRKKHPIKFTAMINNGRKNQYFSESLWPTFLKLALFNDRIDGINWLHSKLTKP